MSNIYCTEQYVRLLDFHLDLAFVEECRLAQKLSQQIATRWLEAKMLAKDPKRAKKTAQALPRADKLFSHGRAIDYRQARDELGLKVEYLPPNHPLWRKIWELHIRCHLSHYRDRQVKIIESRQTTISFGQ